MIKFSLADWRTNASILGLVRILEHSNREYKLDGAVLEIPKDSLENFEENYFKYFSDSYEESLPWYRIVSYDDFLDKKMANLESMDQEDLKILNSQIQLVKDYLSRNNYKKVYPLIDGAEDLDKKLKNIKKIKLRKNEEIGDRLEDIGLEMERLREIIDICKTDKAKKHMRAKGVIYSHINRGLDGVSFLRPQTKFIDVFEDYRSYFIDPFVEDLNKEKRAKNPYQCFSCGGPIDTIGDSFTINLVSNTGFDDVRKSSYVWNHMSDILLCPKCNFLYSMLPAGFSYSAYEGMFINYSRSLEGLIYANNAARARITTDLGDNQRAASYRTLVAAISRQSIEDLVYEENDIQIVRYKDKKYRFNILSAERIELIKKSKNDLKAIEKSSFKQANDYFSIYDLVLDRIFNGQNMFSLLDFLLVNMISKNSSLSVFYNSYHISRINNINYELMIGGMDVGGIDMKKQIYFSSKDGSKLRKAYIERGMENKIAGISYRLLNALKTRNAEAFMHNIINSYMYLNKPVPQNMTLALEDEEKLGLIGYGFVTGLNSFKDSDQESNKKEGEMA